MGPERSVLVMANHGVLACGKTVAEAYDRLYYFERACQVQLYAMWTGRPLKEVPTHVVARTLRQYAESPTYGGKPACDHHFAALKRLLDRTERRFEFTYFDTHGASRVQLPEGAYRLEVTRGYEYRRVVESVLP